jgi:hypothetical protein
LTSVIAVMGQHLPRLAFLRVLLGNERFLEPHEHLYHQFLAKEATLAEKEADRWIAEQNFENYLDEVAIPALRAASDDRKRGVLGRDPINELNQTIAEYIELVQESLEYKREQQSATSTSKSEPARRSVRALILAGRGSLDSAVAQLIADFIRLDLGIVVRCPSLGGLTGIGAAAEAEPDESPDIVALVSVGAVTSAQLELLLRRASWTFPQSRIVVGYWDGGDLRMQREDARVRYAESVTSLIDFVGRTAQELSCKQEGKPEAEESARRLEVVTGA